MQWDGGCFLFLLLIGNQENLILTDSACSGINKGPRFPLQKQKKKHSQELLLLLLPQPAHVFLSPRDFADLSCPTE